MKFDWEDILQKHNYKVSWQAGRAKVPGGWMVSTTILVNRIPSTALAFLPDENHEWVIDKEVETAK